MKQRLTIYFTFIIQLLAFNISFAQFPGGGTTGGKMPTIGHLYGKVLDASTKEPVEFASVALLWYDKDSAVAGCLVKTNGDFSLDNLALGAFRLRISFIGYKTIEQKMFINMQNIDKDLGNIMLAPDQELLKEITVTEEKTPVQMSIDRKVYNVANDISTRGGTGLDAVKNIPSVTVDADGNVSLRNNAVAIYIDGKPSTLTLQQIPADQIDRVEIITNPSVKYDASTTGGILNVIMKRNTKPGYNGMVMGGIGTNNRYNGMGSLNVKQGKFNVFGMYNYNTQTNNNNGFTNRNNILLPPSITAGPDAGQVLKYYNQIDTNVMKNTFQFARAGFDYYINNRNTLTISGNYVHGSFDANDFQHYTYGNIKDSTLFKGDRINSTRTSFNNYTGQMNYQHTYPKQGKEFTTSLTMNSGQMNTNYTYTTYQETPLPHIVQIAQGGTPSWMYTYQADYTNPINDHSKIEAGARSFMQRSFSTQQTANDSNGSGVLVPYATLTNNYNITNLTNAAYINYSSKILGFNYMAGLRFEESYYKGNITNKDISFSYYYPDSKGNKLQYCWFPAVYISKKLPHNQEIQINFSHKINRPNFFQLMPFVFASDNANIQIGNPGLRPEFLNMGELNYNIVWWKLNFLTSFYVRYTQNPITNISYPEASNPNILVNTYQNGSNKMVEGFDNTLKITPVKNLDLMANANVFYTYISYSSGTQVITNYGWSWTGKASAKYTFPGAFSLQLNGNYQAPQIIPQGTTRTVEYMDVTVSKNLKQKLIFTLLLSDAFNSKKYGTNYNTSEYTQQLSRRREVRYLKFTLTYMFGKMDSGLFKKLKQMKKEGGDDQGGGMGSGGGF